MLGNLFKSKRQRELERDIAIQRSLTMHRSHINKLTQHERQYMEKALRAKKQGDKANFTRLCSMVAQTTNQRRGIESQLLHFETILQKRDQFKLMKEFAGGLKAMARSIGDVLKEVNAEDMLRDVEVSLAQSTQMEATMNLVLDRISTSSMNENIPADGITTDAIEKLLGERAAAEEGALSIDKEIDAGLAAIDRELKKERA